MKKLAIACTFICVFVGLPVSAQDAVPEMPQPQKEHAWLEQLAGEWDTVSEVKPPGQEQTMKFKGEESSRMIGGFWLLAENKGDMFGTPFTGIMTLGYEPKSKEYIGTWIDSVGDYMWQYKGSVDGKKLTLENKGPCPLKPPGTMVNFRETLELKDKDHKVFTSSFQDDDGSWKQMLTINFTRKKSPPPDRLSE
jgi:hypothetical protein